MQPTSSKVVAAAAQAPAPAAETAVVARARAGDREAFGDLVERHQDRVFSLALQLCRGRRDDAEELAQEAFLRALQAIAEFRGDAVFSTWMHRIVVNLHLNRSSSLAARARARQRTLAATGSAEELLDGAVEASSDARAPDESAGHGEELRALRRALDGLDESRRAAVVLRDVEGLSYEEIAAILAVPLGTVRSRLARAREELSRALGGSGFRGGEAAR